MANRPEKPLWFNSADTRYQLQRDPRLWFSAFHIRENFRRTYSITKSDDSKIMGSIVDIKEDDAPFNPEEFWNNYWNGISIEAINEFDSEATTCPLEEVSLNSLKNNHAAIAEWDMEVGGKSLLLIDLDCSDIQIRKFFESWLIEKRKHHSLPIARRGKPTTNVELTKDHIGSWQSHRILQVYDLDFWCEVMEKDKFTHTDLTHLAAPDLKYDDAKEWGIEARKKLREALKSLELLAEKGGMK